MANLDELLKTVQKDKKKILSKKEEEKLGKVIQSSTSTKISKQTAIETLVLSNLRLALKICHKYKRKEFELEDLMGYGILGLFTAAQKFDPTRGIRFASYARHWIKESIMKAVREYGGTPKIPVYLVKNLWNIARILSKEGEKISDADLAKRANILEKDAIYLRSLMFKFIQLDAPYAERNPVTPEDIYALKERDKLIYDTLHKILTEEEFEVLAHTHELCGHVKMTLVQIENVLGIKNPRRLKAQALKKLNSDKIMQRLYTDKTGW